MSDKVTVKVIDPNRILFEGEADYALAPGRHGTLGILPNHTAMFAELVEGEVYLRSEPEQLFPITSGILRVKENMVTILIGIDD